jgi:hypothetical protein
MTDRYLRRTEVESSTSLGRSTIYRRIADGIFPRPVRSAPTASAGAKASWSNGKAVTANRSEEPTMSREFIKSGGTAGGTCQFFLMNCTSFSNGCTHVQIPFLGTGTAVTLISPANRPVCFRPYPDIHCQRSETGRVPASR